MGAFTSKLERVPKERILPLLLLSQRRILFLLLLFLHHHPLILRVPMLHLPFFNLRRNSPLCLLHTCFLHEFRGVPQLFHEICSCLVVFFDDETDGGGVDV